MKKIGGRAIVLQMIATPLYHFFGGLTPQKAEILIGPFTILAGILIFVVPFLFFMSDSPMPPKNVYVVIYGLVAIFCLIASCVCGDIAEGNVKIVKKGHST